MANGKLRSAARVLSRTYPEAIAGTPLSMSFTPKTGVFHLVYRPNHTVNAATVIFVPTQVHYPNGYCVRALGARVISSSNSELRPALVDGADQAGLRQRQCLQMTGYRRDPVLRPAPGDG